MKIRNGFVSNSSSSSFVVIVDKEAHDRAVEQLKDHKYVEILKEILSCIGKDKFLGRPVVVISGYDAHGERSIGGFCEYDWDYKEWIDDEVRKELDITVGREEDHQWDIKELVVNGVWNDYMNAIPKDSQMYHSVDH